MCLTYTLTRDSPAVVYWFGESLNNMPLWCILFKSITQSSFQAAVCVVPAASPAHAWVFPVSCCMRCRAFLWHPAGQGSGPVLSSNIYLWSGCRDIGRLGGRGQSPTPRRSGRTELRLPAWSAPAENTSRARGNWNSTILFHCKVFYTAKKLYIFVTVFVSLLWFWRIK